MSQTDSLLHRLLVEMPRRVVRVVKQSPLVLVGVPTLLLLYLLAYAKSEGIPVDVFDPGLLIGAPLLLSIGAIPLVFVVVALAFMGAVLLEASMNRRIGRIKDALIRLRSCKQHERRVAVVVPIMVLALVTFPAMNDAPVAAGLLRAFGIGGGYIATFDVAGAVSGELVASLPDGNRIVSTVPVRVLLITRAEVLVRLACEAGTRRVFSIRSDSIRKRTVDTNYECRNAGRAQRS